MPTNTNDAAALGAVRSTKYSVPVTGSSQTASLHTTSTSTEHIPCRALERTGTKTEQSWYAQQGRPFGELAALILKNDNDWQRRHGVEPRFPGLRLFSISGDVHRPGVFEVESGITLRELIDLAGGIRNGESFKAIALSGPSGGFTPAQLPRASWPRKIQSLLPASITAVELLDLQLHINYFRLWDLMLGAGIVVYGASADLTAQALACLKFFQAESCGKCVPCRIGSTKLAEIGADLAQGRLSPPEISQLQSPTSVISDLAFTMSTTAICGLGTVAPNPLTTLLKNFPDELKR